MNNILFIIRIDALKKSGGDLIQAKYYKEVLHKKFNLKIKFAHEISEKELKSTYWDIVQLFNISRIYEHFYFLKKIKFKYLYLSPIVQPNYKRTKIDYIKSLIRGALIGKIIKYISDKKIEKLYNTIHCVTFLSHKEKEYFENNFFQSKKSIIIHNGVDIISHNNIIYKRDIDFLIVGRIEKSKNSYFIAKLIASYFPEKKTIFIGGKNKYHYKYVKSFSTFLDKQENIDYLGIVNYEKVQEIMLSSRILLNLSLIEVSPLVDLEALSNGMKVLSTSSSFSHLSENMCYQTSNPLDKDEIIEKLTYLQNSKCSNSRKYVNSWDENLQVYLKEIQSTLKI